MGTPRIVGRPPARRTREASRPGCPRHTRIGRLPERSPREKMPIAEERAGGAGNALGNCEFSPGWREDGDRQGLLRLCSQNYGRIS
jgi:hypothetical protein